MCALQHSERLTPASPVGLTGEASHFFRWASSDSTCNSLQHLKSGFGGDIAGDVSTGQIERLEGVNVWARGGR